LTIGAGDPFQPRPNNEFVIEQGFQGGHHVDISLRVRGEMDPLHTDIELILERNGEELARHVVADWLLHADPNGEFCDYPRARLVFVDQEGGLVSPEGIPGLLNINMLLTASLRSIPGAVRTEFDLRFTEIRSLE
jgi:hypothetical protein